MDKVELVKGMVTGAVSAYNHYCDVPADQDLQDRLFANIFAAIENEFPTFAQFVQYVEGYQEAFEGETKD